MLVLHNSIETLARFLNRRIRHLCTTYKMQNVWTFYLKYAMYVCSGGMIQDDRIWQSYVQCGMILWHLLTSFFALFLLLKALFLFFSMATFAQCTNQDSNCVYAGTNLWHTIWYQDMHHDDMVCMLWEVWSLMCTSNVAGNTQMASLDRQVTQNGLGVNNSMTRGIYNGGIPWYQHDM